MFQCIEPPEPGSVHTILDWCFEAVAEGVALPPAGFVADVGHLAFGEEFAPEDAPAPSQTPIHPPFFPSRLVRQYEDLVLGKLYSDRSFDRGVDGLRRYPDRRDRAKGLAFLLKAMGERAGYRGVHFSPAVVRDLERQQAADILKKAAQSLADHGPIWLEDLEDETLQDAGENPLTLLEFLYLDLIRSFRNTGEVLGVEDVFELEHGTAIAGFSQRIALRQVLRSSGELAKGVPHQPVRPLNRRQQVATQILDEDTYPVGGFASISNRGSIESLLHSQLAFMEPAERPDMFDIKFLRDELLYYSRDENQFLRRRRTFVFVLMPSLAEATETDGGHSHQRKILLLALLRVAVETLSDWLSEESLLFEFVFQNPGPKAAAKNSSLAEERELLQMLFREPIAAGSVRITEVDSWPAVLALCEERARRSLCNAVVLSKEPVRRSVEHALLTEVRLDSPVPRISLDGGDWQSIEADNRTEGWSIALVQLLQAWTAG